MARRYVRRERRDLSLPATGLVNECYLRLVDAQHVDWQNRAHFLALAGRMMRRILVDVARARQYRKRGGGAEHVAVDDQLSSSRAGPGSRRAGRGAARAGRRRRAQSPRGGVALLRRAEQRGNGRRPRRVGKNRDARLAGRQGVAASRADIRPGKRAPGASRNERRPRRSTALAARGGNLRAGARTSCLRSRVAARRCVQGGSGAARRSGIAARVHTGRGCLH